MEAGYLRMRLLYFLFVTEKEHAAFKEAQKERGREGRANIEYRVTFITMMPER